MAKQKYSYELEKEYYSAHWPDDLYPNDHFLTYLTTWLDPVEVFNGKRVLDIGAGECAYTRLIVNRFNPKEVIASDLFVKRMMPTVRHNKNDKLKFVQADVFYLPFAEKSFDVVFGSLILHQLPDLEKCVKEISRVLTSNGLYIGVEANPYNLVHLYRYILGKHSKNQYLLSYRHLKVFKNFGFKISVKYFYANLPWFKNRIIGTLMGIYAERITF